ncbi:MAG: protein translocase subunit SecD, partial [Alphaproteobacteria bacterium]
GVHLLLQVDLEAGVRARAAGFEDAVRTALRGSEIRRSAPERLGASVKFRTLDPAEAERAADLIRDEDPTAVVTVGDNGEITVGFAEDDERELRQSMLAQTIEIIRRRVDALGTKEPIIQRQGDDRVVVQVPGFDDPTTLKDVIGTTAQL